MCIAIVVPQGVGPPDLEELKIHEAQNADGGSVAWVEGGWVHWQKDLDAEEVHSLVAGQKGPLLIHFRISTVGGADPYLCHPFPITRDVSVDLAGSARSVLVHNGHWHGWEEHLLRALSGKMPGGPWSDSRAMAYLAHRHGSNVLQLIRERVAVMDGAGEITMYGGWSKEQDRFYSNLQWKIPPNFKYFSSHRGRRRRNWDMRELEFEYESERSNTSYRTEKEEEQKAWEQYVHDFDVEQNTEEIPAGLIAAVGNRK